MSEMTRKPMPILNEIDLIRYWADVYKDSSGCWIWVGCYRTGKRGIGYGQFTKDDICYLANRIAYYIDTNTDPGEKLVLHTCSHKYCVNPDHLYAGTRVNNMLDQHIYKERLHQGIYTPSARVNDAIVHQIRSRPNELLRVLANEFGITISAVHSIRHYETWKHLE